MLRRSVSRQKTRIIKPFPIKLRGKIEENALNLVDEIQSKPFEDILTADEHVTLKTVDQDLNRNQFCDLSNLLEEKKVTGSFSKACDHVCIVGSKRSGKTTVLTEFIKQSLEGSIPQINTDENVVHLIRCHDLDPKKKISISEFLFHGIKNDVKTEDLRRGFDWMCDNPTMLTFVIDSLDTIPYDVKSRPLTGLRDHATPSSILHSLLEGQLFPGCGVVSSCDEKILHCDDDDALPVEKFVAVCGLPPATISKIALSFLGDDLYYRSFIPFENASSYVLSHCKNPSILILTLLSLKYREQDSFLPKTLAGVILHMLLNFVEGQNVDEKEKMTDIINELKYVSHVATSNGRITFKTCDLKAGGSTEQDIEKLSYPKYKIEMFRKVCEDDFECFHPILLQTLSALYIAEMDVEQFEQKISQIFCESKYKYVVRYLPGFLLNDKLFEATLKFYNPGSPKFMELTNNRQRKGTVLKNLIRPRLQDIENYELQEKFDVLHMICESTEELKNVVFEHFDNFCISPFGSASLNSADMCSLATCICWRVHFQCLEMTDCHLPNCVIEAFHKYMMSTNSRAKIKMLSMNYQDGRRTAMGNDAVTLSHLFVHVSEKCDFRGWCFKQEHESCLQDKLNSLRSFGLEVKINKDDILSAQSTWSDIIEQRISPNGGVIEMNDCSLQFPEGCLREPSKVKIEMTNVATNYPEDYIVMSPCINVICKSSLQKPVLVGVKPWCFINDEKIETLDVQILHLDDSDDKWETIKTLTLEREGPVRFECKTFSTILVAIKNIYARFLRFPMTGLLYGKEDSFSVIFFPDHASKLKESQEHLETQGYSRAYPLEFNLFDVKLGDVIGFEPDVGGSDKFYFDIKKQSMKMDRLYGEGKRIPNFSFCLNKKGRRHGSHDVVISFKLLRNGQCKGCGEFPYTIKYESSETEKKNTIRIEDVFQNEVSQRFANYVEFKKFAMSGKGFCISLKKINEIEGDNTKEENRKLEMFSYWMMVQGEKATPKTLRNLLESYFAEAPYTDKDERRRLKNAFEEATSKFKTHEEWFNFLVYGLQMRIKVVRNVIGGQENITRKQKKTLLKMWRKSQGDSASKELFDQLLERYDQSTT